jgi:hypothetical protein
VASQGNLGKITGPTYFISNNKTKKMLAVIVITMQVPQALSASKSQTKIVLDVGGFHLAPNMTIVLACDPCFTFVQNG